MIVLQVPKQNETKPTSSGTLSELCRRFMQAHQVGRIPPGNQASIHRSSVPQSF